MLLFDPTQPGFRGKYLLILDWSGFSKDPKSQPQQIHHIQEVIVSILTFFLCDTCSENDEKDVTLWVPNIYCG